MYVPKNRVSANDLKLASLSVVVVVCRCSPSWFAVAVHRRCSPSLFTVVVCRRRRRRHRCYRCSPSMFSVLAIVSAAVVRCCRGSLLSSSSRVKRVTFNFCYARGPSIEVLVHMS